MISIVRLFAFAAVALFCGGCRFEHPLTERPSKDINTWLLGGWECKGKNGQTSSLRIAPLAADRYSIKASIPEKTPNVWKTYEFEGWISRVDDTNYLTLRCVQSPGDIPPGAYIFFHTQLLDQNNVRIRALELGVPASATSRELRNEVRLRSKDRLLYDPSKTTDWKRVEEVIWSKDGATPSFKPIRNPTF